MATIRTGYPVIDEILESIAPASAAANTEQIAPDTEGEWIYCHSINEFGNWHVRESGNGDCVAHATTERDAAQIVADHKSAKSQALLVEALEIFRSTLTPILRDHAVRGNADRTEGYVLVAVNQIDAALKAAGIGK